MKQIKKWDFQFPHHGSTQSFKTEVKCSSLQIITQFGGTNLKQKTYNHKPIYTRSENSKLKSKEYAIFVIRL